MGNRVLIIYRVDRKELSNQGVINKMNGQVNAFKSLDWEVDQIALEGNTVLLNTENLKVLSPNKYKAVVLEFFQVLSEKIPFEKYDLIYIRYGLSFPGFIKFLKRAKELNAEIKIILELPTFPYDAEWKGVVGKSIVALDKHYRGNLYRYVDKAVHYGEEKEILGIPTILSENGWDAEKKEHDSCIKEKLVFDSSNIEFIAVGKWRFWHGLGRFIFGIANHKKKDKQTKIRLNVVGEGEALDELKQLVTQLGLKEEVLFWGNLVGKELIKLYYSADMGIGTLGIFRKGVKIDSSLKHREYAVNGLPFILSTKDRDFLEGCETVQYHPESEEPINIERVISFLSTIEKSDREKRIQLARERLSWTNKVKKILQQL